MRRLVIGKDWGLDVWNADVAQHTTFMIPREHSSRERHRSLWPTKSFAWRQLGVCFIVSYHYLFYQMPDILGTALQIQISSNNIFVLQLQSIATTCCNESSQYYFHIPQIAALEAFFFGLKSCAGRWAPGSVDTGALFYVACSHFAILRFVSLTYTQLYFYRWKTNKEARRQTLPDVDILQELGDIMKTKSVKFSPNTL